MKFTDRQVSALKPKNDRYEVWEDNGKGLGLRVSSKGTKSFVFMYRFGGRARRMTLGSYPAMSVANAHKEHAKARETLAHGKDPGEHLKNKREEDRKALTVKVLADEYLEKHAKPNKRTWRQDEKMLNADVLQRWGRLKAKNISKRDINMLLDDIVERGAPVLANRVLALVRKMFNFAVSRGDLEINPCAGISRPSNENQRDRVLSEEEIRNFWNNLPKASMSEASRLALKFQLLTAQRKGEVISARWEDFDIDAGWWTIPAAQAKNKKEHRVYLSEQAREVLNQLKVLAGNSQWILPSPRGDKPIGETALNHALRRNIEILGLKKFTIPHDLRRTAASHMTGMGISRLVVSKILNHVERSVTAVYDRHSYDREKEQALVGWSNKLLGVVGEIEVNTVVFLNAKG